jgi:chemotaxis signal transduction protein
MSAEVKGQAARNAVERRPGLRSDYCIFRRGASEFAVSTQSAREVLHTRGFTPVPQAPGELIGAFNLRGEVIPLVNLDRFLGVEGKPPERHDAWLLFGGTDISFAAVVDLVVDIRHIPPWEIDRLTPAERERQALVRGRMTRNQHDIVVLDGERLVTAVVGEIAAAFRRQARAAAPLQIPSAGGEARPNPGGSRGGEVSEGG